MGFLSGMKSSLNSIENCDDHVNLVILLVLHTVYKLVTDCQPSSRKKGGIKHDDDEDSHNDSGSGTNRKEWEEEEMLMKQRKEEAAKKAREEEIWTSFKKDTSFKPALKSTSSKTVRCDGVLFSLDIKCLVCVSVVLQTLYRGLCKSEQRTKR